MGREFGEIRLARLGAQRSGWVFVTILGLVASSLMGCATFGPAPPDITLVNLQFTDLTLFETSGVFIVRLANENPEALAVQGGVYTLYVDGIRVAKGLSDHRFSVPALSSVTDEIEVRVSNLAMATRLQSIFERGAFDYEIRAKVYVSGRLGQQTLRLSQSGFFDFDKVNQKPAAVANQEG